MDKQSWYIHTMKYYPAVKRDKLLIHKTIWMTHYWKDTNPKYMISFIKYSWGDTFFKKEIYNYFTYLSGCTQAYLQHTGSPDAACELLTVPCGTQSLTRDRTRAPQHWKHRVLATGPPGKSQKIRRRWGWQGSGCVYKRAKQKIPLVTELFSLLTVVM